MTIAKANPLCFLDVETTGHDPLKRRGDKLIPWHEIIDLAAVFADPHSLDFVGGLSVLVKPEHPERCLPNLVNDYQRRALCGKWDNAASLSEALQYLLGDCSRFDSVVIPVGQNFFFDWSFLSVGFAWCNVSESEWGKYLHYSRLDTRSMAVQELLKPGEVYNPAEFSLRNDILSTRLGIPPEPYPHEASNGAYQSYLVYKKLRELNLLRQERIT